MKIAIIGGGASGMVTAYLLDRQGHQVTVFEKQPMLGGHIRTLNQNVYPNASNCNQILEGGVLEFPTIFHHFLALMQELGVALEPVTVGSALFLKNGRHYLSGKIIEKNFRGIQRLIEYLRLDTLYARSAGFWVTTKFAKAANFDHQPLSCYLQRSCIRNAWLKSLIMYSYSTPYELLEDFPAELAMPVLQNYIFVDWMRIKGGVYSYIQKILDRFSGEIVLGESVTEIRRTAQSVQLRRANGQVQQFDKLVFATPPDQVLQLLAEPTEAEIKRFSAWKALYPQTIMHTDLSFYRRFGITQASEFDFFQTDHSWGYNASLNQLCGISGSQQYSLAFNLESLIAKDKILHIQQHHTPLYTVEAFRYQKEIIRTNGENHTYHVGAYLGDGLHEGAIASAQRVAQLIGPGTLTPEQTAKDMVRAMQEHG
jgi:predicted NAD/FAD-binding protein